MFANQPGSRISTLAKWIPPELRLLLLHAPFVSIEIIRSARPRNLNRRRTARRKFDFSGPVYTALPHVIRRETSPRRTVPSNYNVGLRNLVRSSVTWSPLSSAPILRCLFASLLIDSRYRRAATLLRDSGQKLLLSRAASGGKLGEIALES